MTQKRTPAAKSLVLVDGGGKGGVGKSTVSCAILEALLRRNLPNVVGIDTDGNGEGRRFIRGYPGQVRAANPFDTMSMDGVLMGLLNKEPTGTVCVIDVGGGLDEHLYRWLANAGPLVAAEQGFIDITYVYVLCNLRQSVERLRELTDRCINHPKIELVVLRNFGVSERFDLFDGSKIEDRIRRQGWRIESFPKLDHAVADQVECSLVGFSTFADEATIVVDGNHISPSIGFRTMARNWLNTAMDAIDRALLIPSPPIAQAAER
jgi:hypothetical protein